MYFLGVLPGGASWMCFLEMLHDNTLKSDSWRDFQEMLPGGASNRCLLQMLPRSASWTRFLEVFPGGASRKCFLECILGVRRGELVVLDDGSTGFRGRPEASRSSTF